MTRHPTLAAVTTAVALALGAVSAGAGALSDFVLAPGVFAGAEPLREPLCYRHTRAAFGAAPALDETLRLAPAMVDDAARLVLARSREGAAPREITSFGTGSANPILLYFLESAARATAEASGGSPFYIRNRIRDALGAADLGAEATLPQAGAPLEVRRTELRPFADDPNRARLGPFADLVLGVTTAAKLPGRLLELSADTPGDGPGYHERLTLLPEVCP